MRGDEVGIRPSLMAQSINRELALGGMPTAQDFDAALGLEAELSEISPRSRQSAGRYGGSDLGGSTFETLPPTSARDWNLESTVSGGAGHGPYRIGYTSQGTANAAFEASLNDNKKTADTRAQWSIANKPMLAKVKEPSQEDCPEDGTRYVARAEVDADFQSSLRNQRPAKDAWRRRTSSDASPRGSSPRSSLRSERTPGGPVRTDSMASEGNGEVGRRRSSRRSASDDVTGVRTSMDLTDIERELERRQATRLAESK